MPIEILMPALSPTMTEGNLAKWLVKEGDTIEAGKVIAEIETDKATMEVEAVEEGTLGKVLVSEGTEGVKVNEVIALLLEEGEDKAALEDYKPKAEDGKQKVDAAEKATKEDVPASTPPASSSSPSPAPTSNIQHPASGARTFASPLAKRLAAEAGIPIGMIPGTGPHGRVVKADVELAQRTGVGAVGRVFRNPVEHTSVPNNNMRKVIARRLTESKQQVPHFYLTVECELDKLLEVRKDLNAEAAAEAGKDEKPAYKISVNDMIIKASALAMKKVPEANASWTDEAILMYNNVDVSVAVAIEGGLITPIVKNADQKSIVTISGEMKELAAKARAGKLQPEEFQGGTYSLSNLGMFGIKHFSAIINPPQGCILAVGAGAERAVVKKGQISAATVMEATLSVDHRVVDGAVGAEFLSAFKRYMEAPSLLLV